MNVSVFKKMAEGIKRLSGWRLYGFFGVVLVLRQALEWFESVPPFNIWWVDLSTLVHAGVFYTWFFVVLAMVLRHFMQHTWREVFEKLLRISPLMLAAPLIDLLFYGRYGVSMSYHFATPGEFVWHLFSFFGPMTVGGVTFGMRVQVLGIICLFAYWVYKVRTSIGESLLAMIATYGVIYVIASTPSLFGWVQWMVWGVAQGSVNVASLAAFNENVLRAPAWGAGDAITIFRFNMVMAQLWLLGLFSWYLYGMRSLVARIYTKSRALRAGLYVALFWLGAIKSSSYILNVDINFTLASIVTGIFASFVVLCAWTYAFAVNDVYDVIADELVHTDRALPRKKLSRAAALWVGILAGGSALAGSLLLAPRVTLGIWIFLVCASLYSVKPLQLRRFFVVPQVLMAIASVAIYYAGFMVLAKGPVTLSDVYFMVALGALLFGFWFFKDIEDAPGDSRAGYKTVMTVFGVQKGPRVAFGLFVASSIVAFVLVPVVWKWFACLALHAIAYTAVKKGEMTEKRLPIFLVLYLFVLSL